VTGAATASFVYDGDGKQIKATVNGTSTVYVGNHYEIKNSVVTKYYFAGSMRLAVRTGGTLSFLLSDHLGSSSVTTDANGAKTASALYKAFGETRYTLGNLNTDYHFTGQREESTLGGIYWFQSRWMDPSLGRFMSPDSIVPTSTQGTQGFDRYAYVNNSPLKYTDPSGHVASECGGDDTECDGSGEEDLIDLIYEKFGVTVTPDAYWNYTNLSLLFRALGDFRSFIGEDKYNDLLKGAGLTVEVSDVCDGCGGEYDPTSGTLFIDPEAFSPRTEHSTGETESAGLSFMHTVVHEMTHALVYSMGGAGMTHASFGYATGWNNPGGGEWVNPGTGPTDYAKGLIVAVDPMEDLAESVAVLIYPRIPNTGLVDGRAEWIYTNIGGTQP
jgi:RHS repeat-associated protein